MVKFSFGNMKLNAMAKNMGLKQAQVVSFDLPAGWTCPKANICKTFANKENGKMRKVGKIVCYASKAEGYSPSARRLRWYNFDALKACKTVSAMAELINGSLPEKVKIVRLHSSGDFFNKMYFMAWVMVARMNPEIVFFGYTKILNYAMAELPDNMRLQYSYGSMDDERMNALIARPATCYIGEFEGQYPYKVVCGSKDKAHEDFIAIQNRESFVLSIH